LPSPSMSAIAITGPTPPRQRSQGKLSAGFNMLRRSYDRMDGVSLDGFDVLKFQGGTLPVTASRLALETHTTTIAGFADYGVLDNLDVGVLIPYVHLDVAGAARIYGPANDELQRVLIDASAGGLGDIALFGKYRFWTIEPAAAAVVPFLSSSLDRFCVGTGMRPGTAPVKPAKSPSPSITAGESAIFTSFASASSASAKASFAE